MLRLLSCWRVVLEVLLDVLPIRDFADGIVKNEEDRQYTFGPEVKVSPRDGEGVDVVVLESQFFNLPGGFELEFHVTRLRVASTVEGGYGHVITVIIVSTLAHPTSLQNETLDVIGAPVGDDVLARSPFPQVMSVGSLLFRHELARLVVQETRVPNIPSG